MQNQDIQERIEILSKETFALTISRLASQVLECAHNSRDLLLLGIPTRGVQLAEVLASELKDHVGHEIDRGVLDPTFYRDDLKRVGTRMVQPTEIHSAIDGRQVVLVDDVIFTGRTVRAALEALQAWGRAEKVMLLVMIDRGHRELPIQPDFCGRSVPTRRIESIEVRFQSLDGEEGVYLLKN